MRFHIMHKKINQPKEEYRVFFETDSIDEAKYFAMRLAFDETNNVYVQDTKREEIVRDFDALVYRVCPAFERRTEKRIPRGAGKAVRPFCLFRCLPATARRRAHRCRRTPPITPSQGTLPTSPRRRIYCAASGHKKARHLHAVLFAAYM